MSDTTQLRALRDALPGDTAPNTRAWVDRAIAALEAEGAKACERCVASNCVCHCKLPCSKHQAAEQPAPLVHGPEHGCAQAQQPARTAVPPMPPRKEACEFGPRDTVVRWGSCQTIHAAAQAIAAERNAALEQVAASERCLDYWKTQQEVEAEKKQEAERERDEARAELAALKAQEPWGYAWPSPHFRASNWIASKGHTGIHAVNETKLYAAPVASITLAQHEAALAEARRAERERCAVVADENGAIHTARAIRALRDGGEG